jgi:hypothetical protein
MFSIAALSAAANIGAAYLIWRAGRGTRDR